MSLVTIRKKSLAPTTKCQATTSGGRSCKKWAIRGSSLCLQHQTKLPNAQPKVSNNSRFGIYARQLSVAQREIYAEAVRQGVMDDFRRPDLEEELAIARILLADMLAADNLTNSTRLRAIELVSKIAKTAKLIKELDQATLKQDFLSAVMDAINYAFQRANGYTDPAERGRVFVSEFSSFFPLLNDAGEAVYPEHEIVQEVEGEYAEVQSAS